MLFIFEDLSPWVRLLGIVAASFHIRGRRFSILLLEIEGRLFLVGARRRRFHIE